MVSQVIALDTLLSIIITTSTGNSFRVESQLFSDVYLVESIPLFKMVFFLEIFILKALKVSLSKPHLRPTILMYG